jgi:hypothetical protein
MKKKFSITIFSALGMTVPLIFSMLYSLVSYGNMTEEIGMGGIEIGFFLYFVAAPIFLLSLIGFIYRVTSTMDEMQRSQEVKDYFIYIIILGSLGYFLWELNSYCSSGMNMCPFIPLT